MARTRTQLLCVFTGTLALLGTVGACGEDESDGSATTGGSATAGALADAGAGGLPSEGPSGGTGGSGVAGSSVAGSPSASGPALAELPPLLADAMCGIYEDCFGQLFDLFLLEDCAELTERRVAQGGFSRVELAVQSGSVQYDPARAEECLSAYEARGCDDLLARHIEACEEALEGTLQTGDECELDEECAGDAICLVADACPGHCAPRQPAGESCHTDDQCADGLVCSKVTNLCVEPRTESEACEGGSEAQCAPGLLCLGADEDEARTGTCREVDALLTAAEGQTCDIMRGPLCQQGLTCAVTEVPASGAADSLPGACEPTVGSGEDCHLSVPSQCPEGEYCSIEIADVLLGQLGTCTPLPRAGEACAPDLGPRCEAFARCVDDSCVAMRDLGESCTVDDVCYSGRCVDGGCTPGSGC